MSRRHSSSDEVGITSYIGCLSTIVITELIFGGVATNYLLEVFLGKVLSFFWAVVVGLLVGSFTIPAAILVWILKTFGIM